MAPPRRFELDDAVNRPGTYYNPSTDMLVVVDDSAALDPDLFEGEAAEDTDWVLVADEVPVDETSRDLLIERFEARHHEGSTGAVPADDDDEDEIDEIEPDPEEDEDY
jgi:hypothetical protein